MTTVSGSIDATRAADRPGSSGPPAAAPLGERNRSRLLYDLTGIDLSARPLDRAALERFLPHRGEMALLDYIVWHDEGYTRAVALKHVRADEFWVPGHFPGKPLFPGVLMIEAGAQAGCFMFNAARDKPVVAAFLRIDEASFRASVEPGDDLYILCREVKRGRRNFTTDVQGVVRERVAFEARVSGMSLSDD